MSPILTNSGKVLYYSNRKMTNKYASFAIFAATLLIGALLLFQVSKSRTFQFFGGITSRVETSQKVVALTFDDAPTPKTTEILDILKEKQIKATFYEIGKGIEEYPGIAKAIIDAGMEVGNHSYSHERFLLKSQSFIDSEIQKTNTLIRNSGYKGEITFRPPNGKKLFGLPWYLHQHSIKAIMWDVEPDTFVPALQEGNEKTKFLVDYTMEHTRPGSIILLHPFCDSCVSDRQAIGKIIEGLKSQGYNFITVSELLTY
jgi:peptidoglycan-N-acetylglucosamine deacetylase